MLKKKFGPIFKELLKFLPKKFSICSQIYGFGIRDPRSGIRKNLFLIPDPESRGQKGTGSRIRIRNTVRIVNIIELRLDELMFYQWK